jgi:GAF domain-containing protein
MRPRLTEPDFALREHIERATALPALLDLFAEEIDKLNLVDGLLINLRDANSEFLICLKIRFTAEFQALEKTYYRYKVALSGDAQNLNARAFHSRGIVQCDLESASESQRNLLRAWKLQEIAAMAILDDDDFSQAPLGTLLLLKQEGQIGDDVFIAVEQLITLFYQPLRHALQASFLREHRQRDESVALQQSRFLQFAVELNRSTSTETIYQTFATEMFRQFAFDGLGFFLLENQLLVNQRVETADPHYEPVSRAWQSYLQTHPYELNTVDGGVSHTYLKDLPLLFYDIERIVDLPMSEKDRESLLVLQTARTLLLVPIRHNQKPVGVLVFYSLEEPVDISESQLDLICRLASFFGAALANSNRNADADTHAAS